MIDLSALASAVLPLLLGTAPDLSGPTFWMPEQASSVASDIDWIFTFITRLCYFFFVLIVVTMVVFIVKYRRREGHRAEVTATHNTPLELTWTIVPLILVIAIFYVGMRGYVNLRQAPQGTYEVQVTGQKWQWTFEHRNGAIETGILRVPVNRPVKLVITSTDVLHSVYIPAFRVKMDAVPGRITTLWFEAETVGDYDLFCAEYCGTSHSQMNARVLVYSEDDFPVAIEEAANWIDEYADEDLHRAGARLFNRCSSCHSLDGRTNTGPTWQGMWQRTEEGTTVFTDGTTLADLVGPGRMYETPEDYMMQSIVNPQEKIVANYTGAMPTFQGLLKPREILAIVQFMKRLDEFELDDKGNPVTP
jgi:cytochrome c oxidase subunit 2